VSPIVGLWYRVRNLEAAREFYVERLGFEELYFDQDGRWMRLARSGIEISIAEGEAGEGEAVAQFEVEDVKAEAERLRAAGVDVGVVLELHGTIRLVDVFDPDGNRVQLTQDL
jgi:catechol 2,3-dioxygenase-like lactoylglutathione lyase family enzyme